ncbi:hypothetical protein, partial [Staphylococcus aureus]
GGLSAWEKGQQIRKIVITAANNPGTSTPLRAKLDGRDWAQPVGIQVVMNQNSCHAGVKTAEITPSLVQELEKMPLRDAVIRIA